MIVLIVFAFLSGVVTILSPCILPMLPIILTGSIGKKLRPYGIVAGFVLSFVIFTLSLSFIVDFFKIPPTTLRAISIVTIISFGLIMFIPKLKEKFESIVSTLNRKNYSQTQNKGFGGGLLIGFSLGILWTPCVGPIMASVITLAATNSVDTGSAFIILAYSIGTSIPMFGVIISGRKLINKFSVLSKNPIKLQRFFGVVMILMGIAIGLNLDRLFQAKILEIFPEYGSGLTILENNKIVKKVLEERDSKNSSFKTDKEPKNGILGNYGIAPIVDESIQAKVILIDFWTYSCVNCIRTIPYLKEWYKKYHEYGLEIIGVHTPEFVFERDKNNVNKAIRDLGITWPVIQDNKYEIWKSYNNKYWPAKYFIDSNGIIRYFHFGEGDYDTSENVIRGLLIDAGVDIKIESSNLMDTVIETNTPEIYLGYKRSEGFSSNEQIAEDKKQQYTSIPLNNLQNAQWSLSGNWIITKEYIVPQNEGDLNINFNAKNVFIVVEPERDSTGTIEIQLDSKIIEVLNPDSSKLYKIIDLEEKGEHILKLKVKGKLRLFAFTFG